MILDSLELYQFRNFKKIQMALHPRCNVFFGTNGQGKTSILEAIYLLSRGQSFRTRLNQPILHFGSTELYLEAKTTQADNIRFYKSSNSKVKAELNAKSCLRLSDLSKLLPCQLFHQDIFQIIDAHAEYRRRLLDWGVFYTNPHYNQVWKNFKRALLQRNTVLKQGGSGEQLTVWNHSFVTLSEQLTQMRLAYLEQLNVIFTSLIQQFSDFSCSITFFNGWDKTQNDGSSLLHKLLEQEPRDKQSMFTHAGPQHADLWFLTQHGKGKTEWSRGQQKVILIVLKLAQTQLLQNACLFLLDDLIAELGQQYLQQIYQLLNQAQGQLFITTLDERLQTENFFANSRWFYLQGGRITKTIDI